MTFTLYAAAIAVLFVLAYALVVMEDKTSLPKSKPMLLAAGLIWFLVALAYAGQNRTSELAAQIDHALKDYAEILLFLLAAMGYVNALTERKVFEDLRTRLMKKKLSLRGAFWLTGALAFFLSPLADNLTTALVMGSVVIAIGKNQKDFIATACINIVIAANAGGAFSPFGDITSLMIWQKGVLPFEKFFLLFVPALVSWLVPAFLLSLSLPKAAAPTHDNPAEMKQGGLAIAGLFLLTIAQTLYLHHELHLPSFLGMMTGLGYLKLYGHFIRKAEAREAQTNPLAFGDPNEPKPFFSKPYQMPEVLEKVEWETLLFFYGVMFCISGLGAMGLLDGLSTWLYKELAPTTANIGLGLLSSVVDNIPLTFAVLKMDPMMTQGEWLLIALTMGIGGSLLSVGSAAGVALMGSSEGHYTFTSHLRQAWTILLGYAAGIGTHLILNANLI